MTIQGVFLLITVCIWLLNLFPLNGNSIASKGLSTNSDLQSSHQLEENTEDRREAMLDLAAKLQTTESTLQPTIQQLLHHAIVENTVPLLTAPN